MDVFNTSDPTLMPPPPQIGNKNGSTELVDIYADKHPAGIRVVNNITNSNEIEYVDDLHAQSTFIISGNAMRGQRPDVEEVIQNITLSNAEDPQEEQVNRRYSRISLNRVESEYQIENMDLLLSRFEDLEKHMMGVLTKFQETQDEQVLETEAMQANDKLEKLLESKAGKQALRNFGYVPQNNGNVIAGIFTGRALTDTELRHDELDALHSMAGNEQVAAIEAGKPGFSVPDLIKQQIANNKKIQEIHKAAKKFLEALDPKDKDLSHIEKLIFKLHDIDAKRYKILDSFLKGGTLTAFTAAGVVAVLGAVGIIGSAAAVAAASLIGIPAAIMIGAGAGWFLYKTIRNTSQDKHRLKWLEIARHEGKAYDKLRAQGKTDEDIDVMAQHKLAAHDPRYATLLLWAKLKEAAMDRTSFSESNIYKYLKIYGFKPREMIAIAQLDNQEGAITAISKKLAIPMMNDDGEDK